MLGSFKMFLITCAGLGLVSLITKGSDRGAERGLIDGTKVSTGANFVTGSIALPVAAPDYRQINVVPWLMVWDKPEPDRIARTAQTAENEEIAPSRRKPSVADLGISLQRELKRVGCYGDVITTEWTDTAKLAMRAFNSKVNATLPVEAPDHILLTLVSGHKGRACDKPCSSSGKAGNCAQAKHHVSTQSASLHRASFKVESVGSEPARQTRIGTANVPVEPVPPPKKVRSAPSLLPLAQPPVEAKSNVPSTKTAAGSSLKKTKNGGNSTVAASPAKRDARMSSAGERRSGVTTSAPQPRQRVASGSASSFASGRYFYYMTYRGS